MSKKWRVAGINFSHMHMGDNLRMAFEHPAVEIVGIADENRAVMEDAIKAFSLKDNQVFTNYKECIEKSNPDIVILCPPTAEHADWVEKVALYPVHIILEKPFASSLEDVDRILRAMEKHQKRLLVNWPLAWVASHVTAKKVIDEGMIGEVLEVRFYDGNRGPLWHRADKVETTLEEVNREKPHSWFYKKKAGGGSLLDYLGYGATLGTWYHNGRKPLEVITVMDEPANLEVDEHSITIVRYSTGLSKMETRWGTFTDPWVFQPQPKCGFVIVGREGTISSYDYEPTIRVQNREHPEGIVLDSITLEAPNRNPVEYLVDCIENQRELRGPVSPEISRIGQVIVDAAYESGTTQQRVNLENFEW
ncbi:MAG: Gfo/Idh/MocA family protein [Sphaerochaetaceae bacterium]|jgi:predicted dehydrogenase|nr:Gfo/Idh/MocA family oxidoreductase [Sphaerochaetaceae bacterium]